jgi:hypothetical protein
MERLEAVVPAADARLYAWCLLSNHFHLVLLQGTGRFPGLCGD